MKEILFKCLDYNPANRPVASELWKTLRVLVIKSELDEVIDLKQEMEKENMCNCLILGDLCQSADKIRNQSSRCTSDTCVVENANQEEADGVEKLGADKDVVEGLSGGQVKCIDLKGHLNCITGLVIGGTNAACFALKILTLHISFLSNLDIHFQVLDAFQAYFTCSLRCTFILASWY